MAKNKPIKTNVVRLLEAAGVEFDTQEYPVDENNLAAQHIADVLNEDINRVFKTLVLRGERTGLFVCVIPGNCEVDLKKAASVAGDKKAEMIAMKELLPLTGYIRGGCSPIGMKKPYPTFFHNSATNYDYIYVSAGVRGLQLKISPIALINYVGATTADLVK
ncbi:MAG: Cys-tRNA(Pro) deacylase [Muribaculaceae bacterium]|nr:Cys-tRNA(Pro) deacylase [Muribaculaceae bacterium]